MAVKNFPNAQTIAAQEAFERDWSKFAAQGFQADIDFVEMIRNSLIASGMDFTSRKDIDGFMSIVEPEYERFQREGKELLAEQREILIKAGATELELEWGNTSQARPNWWQRRRLEKLEEQLDRNDGELLMTMTLAAILNDAKEAIGEA